MMAALTQLLAGLTQINFNMLVDQSMKGTERTIHCSTALYHCFLFVRMVDTASLEFGAAPEAVSQVQPALRLRVADIVSTPGEGKTCQLISN